MMVRRADSWHTIDPHCFTYTHTHTHTNAHDVCDRGWKEIFLLKSKPRLPAKKAHDALSHTTQSTAQHKHTGRPSCHTCAYNDQISYAPATGVWAALVDRTHSFFHFSLFRPYGNCTPHSHCTAADAGNSLRLRKLSHRQLTNTDLVCRFYVPLSHRALLLMDRVWMMRGFFTLFLLSPFFSFSSLSFSFVSLFTPDATLLSTRFSRSG